jgi:hypothetical protein
VRVPNQCRTSDEDDRALASHCIAGSLENVSTAHIAVKNFRILNVVKDLAQFISRNEVRHRLGYVHMRGRDSQLLFNIYIIQIGTGQFFKQDYSWADRTFGLAEGEPGGRSTA